MDKKSTNAESPNKAVRQRILSCAIDLFTRKGYTATTVREIVGAAGVTKPVLYYYFRNKEGIYLELLHEAFTKFDLLLKAFQRERGSATKGLLHLTDQLFSLFIESIPSAKLMYTIYYGPPQDAPFFDFDAHFLKFQNTLRRLIKIGIQQGEFRKGSVKDTMWVILGVMSVATSVQLSHPEVGMNRRKLAQILKVIFQGISAQREDRKGNEND